MAVERGRAIFFSPDMGLDRLGAWMPWRLHARDFIGEKHDRHLRMKDGTSIKKCRTTREIHETTF